tara:strand:- start:1318 stop:1770 length:453 start_codon:yes stop_codon:yes gene_type:complete
MVVGLHHITWRATVSAVADESVVADAIAWLVGDPEMVEIEQTTSYHGSVMYMVTGRSKKKANSLKSLSRIGAENIQNLLVDLEPRFDENNTLHFRLDFNSFIDGEAVLAAPGGAVTIKCQTKVEVYPGQDPLDECKKVLQAALGKVISDP